MKTRNLRLLVIDDVDLADAAPADVDLVRITTPHKEQQQLNGWLQHSLSLGRHKSLQFDMMTVDINFCLDGSDPANLIKGDDQDNCSGLYHGMMALARRATVDSARNALPLAWAMRTVDPKLFDLAGYQDLAVETVRVYGLLRSLLAQQQPQETLAGCIIREHQQLFRRMARPPVTADSELLDVMHWDLTEQDAIRGASSASILGKLLPRWRLRFLEAVGRCDVRLDRDQLHKTISQLRPQVNKAGEAPVYLAADAPPCVALADGRGQAAYGLNLRSIMADLAGRKGIPLNTRAAAISGVPTGTNTVFGWLEALLSRAGDVPIMESRVSQFLLAAERIESLIKSNEHALLQDTWTGWKYDPFLRAAAYCVLHIRHWLIRRRTGASISQQELVRLYPVVDVVNVNTFRRPVKSASIGGIQTPRELWKALREAMLGTDTAALGQEWELWIKEALKQYVLRHHTLVKPDPSLRGLFT